MISNVQTVIDLVRDPLFPPTNLSRYVVSSEFCDHYLKLNQSKCDDLYVEVGLYANGTLLCPPQNTSFKKHNKRDWKDWIVFPVQYRDVTYDTKVCFTIWDVFSPRKPCVVAGASLYLFDQKINDHQTYFQLKTGSHKVKLWRKLKADHSNSNTTPGEIDLQDNSSIDEITRIEKIWLEHQHENANSDSWLDRVTTPIINQKRKEAMMKPKSTDGLFLGVEFQKFNHPVLYYECNGDQLDPTTTPTKTCQVLTDSVADKMITTISSTTSFDANWIISDMEINRENPCAVKHLKLTMHLSTGFLDRDLRPDATDQKILTSIIDASPLQEISPEEKTIIWKYRYWLLNKKRTLTKFLRCVDWSIMKEKREATDLIVQWVEIDTVDALQLLSKFFQNVDVVRNYAVEVLKKADNDEILGILLQLVQALRYEKDMRTCALSNFLLDRSLSSFTIANNIHWYLVTEASDPTFGDMFSALHIRFTNHLKKQAEMNSKFIFIDQIFRQKKLVGNLIDICTEFQRRREPREVKIKNLKKIIQDIEHKDISKIPGSWQGVFRTGVPQDHLCLPVDPTVRAIGIYAEEATIFKSATNPVRLSFVTPDSKLYRVIFKIGDDLRQDQLVIQLITVMDNLLRKVGLDLKLTPYRVLACSKHEGFLECVTPSTPFEKIIRESDIRKWLEVQNKGDTAKFETALDNFVKSCAGYCVITYILGIGDRHLENLLLTPDGKLFHIDFGFILGRDPKPFAPPMKLCKEMIEGMGGRDSLRYTKFLELCCTAYDVFRKNAHLILNMLLLMVDARIPDIDFATTNQNSPPTKVRIGDEVDQRSSVQDQYRTNANAAGRAEPFKNIMKVQERLKLELSEPEANKFIQGVIRESERALFSTFHDHVHRWVQYWRD